MAAPTLEGITPSKAMRPLRCQRVRAMPWGRTLSGSPLGFTGSELAGDMGFPVFHFLHFGYDGCGGEDALLNGVCRQGVSASVGGKARRGGSSGEGRVI
jgi:hypothetical protein